MAQGKDLLSLLGQNPLVDYVPGLGALIAEKGQGVVVERGKAVCKQGAEIKHVIIPVNATLKVLEARAGVSVPALGKPKT